MPHMHYRGTEMKVWIEHEHQLTGSALDDTCLVHAVDYRFDFQNNYLYAMQSLGQLPTLEDYDVVYVRCTYDNSWGNPFMEEALAASGDDDLVDVYWGEETGDEMCMAVVGFVTPQIDLSTLF
ncbi:MAG: hypothetical protein D6798_09100 [Deltaproteobacteria bacterium]|nr:MAG: hypothetical protein D6798_09100 [Deltaproteobacteria bacterium]